MTTTRGRHSQADAGIGVPYLRRRVRELAEQAAAAASGIAMELSRSGLDDGAMSTFASLVTSRTRRIRQTI